MNKQFHSDEFAGPRTQPAAKGAQFAKGDRVQVTPTGQVGTVQYAHESTYGHFVTVRIDSHKKDRVYNARELRRMEALF